MFYLSLCVGKYIFLETSAPRRKGDIAQYLSTAMTATNGSCLTFWYHMNGNDIGTLNIGLKRAGTFHPLCVLVLLNAYF